MDIRNEVEVQLNNARDNVVTKVGDIYVCQPDTKVFIEFAQKGEIVCHILLLEEDNVVCINTETKAITQDSYERIRKLNVIRSMYPKLIYEERQEYDYNCAHMITTGTNVVQAVISTVYSRFTKEGKLHKIARKTKLSYVTECGMHIQGYEVPSFNYEKQKENCCKKCKWEEQNNVR